VAPVYGLSPKTLGFAVKQTEEREDEIREAWNRHFGDGHLRWPELDVDLTLASIDRPGDYPLVSRKP